MGASRGNQHTRSDAKNVMFDAKTLFWSKTLDFYAKKQDVDEQHVIVCPADRALRANRQFWHQKHDLLPGGARLESKFLIFTLKRLFFAQRSVPWEQIYDFDAKNMFCPAERALRANLWFLRKKRDLLPSGARLESNSDSFSVLFVYF